MVCNAIDGTNILATSYIYPLGVSPFPGALVKPSFHLPVPSLGLSTCCSSLLLLGLGCATAPPDDPSEPPGGGPPVVDAGAPVLDAGSPPVAPDAGEPPAVDAGPVPVEDAGTQDAGEEPPPPPPPEPLFEGSFAGSSNVNGQNRLWALVYRAPGASGHDHVVRSPNFSGTFNYRVGNIDDCSVTVRVPVAALINDEDEMRDEVGLADVSGDWGWSLGGGAEAVNNNMLAANQLDASGHPNITFTSTACRGDAGTSGSILVDGDMTLKGVTRSVTWNVDLNVTSSRVTATGSLSILQSDFGITPYAFLGFQNDDEVDLEFDIVITD